METAMKSIPTNLALFIAVLILPLAAVGQDKEASPDVASNDGKIENVVVVGQKSLAELRRDVYRAEEDFYSVYNKLNDDKEYDVRCFYETPTGTHLKNHICRAKFVSKAYSDHAARSGNKLTRMANQNANPVLA